MLFEKYDLEADVVVVGYGGAGATAAITAHDNGASVIVLEKMPSGGGNTYLSGGTILNPVSMEAVQYMERLSFGTVDKEIIETYVQSCMKNADWLRENGAEVEFHRPTVVGYPFSTGGAAFPKLPGAKAIAKVIVKGADAEGTNAQRLWKFLSGCVQRRGIKVMAGAPAKELMTNSRGQITGVMAEEKGKPLALKCRRAVILTCGGFEWDEAMKWDFLPCKPFHSYGNPGNTGDGIRMAQKAGAALWHMGAVSAYLGFKTPEYQAAFQIRFLSEGFIFVDKASKRFANEVGFELHDMWRAVNYFDPDRIEFPRIPAHAIFDETTRRKGPLYTGIMGLNRDIYKWSLDNSKEIAKGWVIQGKTVSDLAKQMSVDEAALENTISRYNEGCKSGRDADFNRPKQALRALEGPPYYAIKVWPSLINTQGGPRRDKESRVLNPDGKPIPRLYAAGELGSIWGFMYQGSGNVGECLAFGRIAGQNAAKESPWG
ncbi:MAG: FAD-dependent oxidoreductase [Chloroflexi bacterium]|nr:FAD-dependent oxidoreductase [Chloroflexota bacterium]